MNNYYILNSVIILYFNFKLPYKISCTNFNDNLELEAYKFDIISDNPPQFYGLLLLWGLLN